MIWNETIECMDREEMRKLQSLRLKRVVEHAYHNSPFYRKKMQEMGITPDDVQTIDDITKLPFTVKPVSYTHLDVYKRQGYYRWVLW